MGLFNDDPRDKPMMDDDDLLLSTKRENQLRDIEKRRSVGMAADHRRQTFESRPSLEPEPDEWVIAALDGKAAQKRADAAEVKWLDREEREQAARRDYADSIPNNPLTGKAALRMLEDMSVTFGTGIYE